VTDDTIIATTSDRKIGPLGPQPTPARQRLQMDADLAAEGFSTLP
jgi:hypothetical protein